jgi:hypothetical protein
MDENILAWNVTNWVTVILMASIGFFLVGIAMKWLQAKRSGPAITANSGGPVVISSVPQSAA